MNEHVLEKLFEHNNWANQEIFRACADLSDEQLDAEPLSTTRGSIRITLTHLAASQQGYLNLLTLPVEARREVHLTFDELEESARESGEGLLALARGEREPLGPKLRTTDGYVVDSWVVLLQAINHATEHREQIKSMLTALGITPPDLDGWTYGEFTGALKPIGENQE